MAQILFFLFILLTALLGCIVIYNHIIHPLIFKEELEETLETAAEEKIRRNVNEKAEEILGGNDADSK